MSSSSKVLRAQLHKLFKRQHGKCCYCGQPMRLLNRTIQEILSLPRHERHPPDQATLEHLDSRYSPLRGQFRGESRHKAACWKCNNDRAILEQTAIDRTVLQKLAGNYRHQPTDGIDHER